MRKLRLRKGFWIILPAFVLSFFATSAKADTYTAYGASDFFFNFDEISQFTVRTYAWQNGIDSMLWLYNSNNEQIAANDDYYGLDSYIDIILQPGTYRLRTGVCCGNPEAWYGQNYAFETNVNGEILSTTTTVLETTTTTQPPLPEGYQWGFSPEGGFVDISAPDGYVFSEVIFASYGTPNGQNGNWENGNCHAENSFNIVGEYAIGNSSLLIPANNSIFGDPCPGVYKRLAITLLHAPVATTTTTTMTTTTTTTTTIATTTTTSTTTTVPASIVPETIPSTTAVSPTTTTTTTTTIPTAQIEDVDDVLNNIDNLNSAAIVSAIANLLSTGIDNNEAAVIASTPEVLASITEEQAKEIFSKIEIGELTIEQEKELAESLSQAPDEIKQKFEEEVNIYSEGFDDYVPSGSSIDVGARRAIIAVTTVAASITVTAPSVGATGASTGGSVASGDRSSNRSRRS